MSLLSLTHRLSGTALHHAHVARSAVAAMACRSMSSGAAAAAAQPAAAASDESAAAAAAAAAAALPPLRLGSASNRVNFAVPRVRAGQSVSKASSISYPLTTAVGLVRACATASFDETVELAIRLNLDPRKANQSVRGAAALPHGTGKVVRVAVFAKGEKAQEARAAGADIVGEKDLVDQILGGKINFDRCIATPDMMAFVGRVARILGPRGLMPNPKVGTVTADVMGAVKSAKQGSVEFKTDKNGVVHVPMGKVSFSAQALAGNIEAFVDKIVDMKPSGAPKGAYIMSAHLSSTHGPGVPLDTKAAPFKAQVIAAGGATSALSSTASMGAYGRMNSVGGFDVIRYDLGPHPSAETVASAKGKWPQVRQQIKRSRADGDSWGEVLAKVDAINSAPATTTKKPSTPQPSKFGKDKQ